MTSRLFKATGATACFLALFFMWGGHWLAFQSVAWARMLVEFSKTDSVSEAVEKTFDGKHPCKMCVGIREGRSQEKREEHKSPILKLEKLPEFYSDFSTPQTPLPPSDEVTVAGFVSRLHADFQDTPPVPPPRFHSAVA
jgi:hypothetical protein